MKEEPGRRESDGSVRSGGAESEVAAKYLAGEMACLANTPGGGAIILGIADDGTRIGTSLEGQWLRHRIWQITERKLTVAIREFDFDGTHLLVLSTHAAIEPIRYEHKIKWRVDDHCVEVDPTTWHTGRFQEVGLDWSAQPSGHTFGDVRPAALDLARRYLGKAEDDTAKSLAMATDPDLLRRLNLVDSDGRLTNAGSLMFVATPSEGIDYIRRDVQAGDSTLRIRSQRALIEQVWEVDQASQAANRVIHLAAGFAQRQIRAIPAGAIREAIVNGVVHRDWAYAGPTVVEHVGDVLTVTSPGGFIGGVTSSNIITHPAVPRYRSLAEAMSALHLAEREGIGVDRMVRDMLAIGRPQPEIVETPGPYVRVGLVGGDPDPVIIQFLSSLQPSSLAYDLDVLLLLGMLIQRGWIDAASAAPVLQRPGAETEGAIAQLTSLSLAIQPVVEPVAGIPEGDPIAYRLSAQARRELASRLSFSRTIDGRKNVILSWAEARHRVSSTEAMDIAGASLPTVTNALKALEEEGRLLPGRDNRRGRNFHYLPAPGLSKP
ncbi:MAG: ATP-binding protein [Candidatus Dormiibacterota bacterium]